MLRRLKLAANKLLFCRSISADLRSFVKLLGNTKKQRSSIRNKSKIDKPVRYNFIFNNQPKTIYLRTYSGDITMLYEILWQKVYSAVINKIRDVHTIVDAGANIGMTSLFFNQHFPQATIYALEPDVDNFEILTENLSEEIRKGVLVPVNAAIAEKDGNAYVQKNEFAYNSLVSKDQISDSKIRAYSMHTLLRDMMIEQIDILKIDIEGMEADVFNGDISWLSSVQTIVMECHSPEIKNLCTQKLIIHGFNISGAINEESSIIIGVKNR